jgi:hypothetical protein
MPAHCPGDSSPGDTGLGHSSSGDSRNPQAALAALERLAAALGSRDFATTLVTGPGRPPRLTVASRHSRLTEDIYADTCYRWSWADPICAVDDPLTAASKIAMVLRTVPAPTHG